MASFFSRSSDHAVPPKRVTDSGPFNSLSLVVAETAMGAWRQPGQSLRPLYY